MGEGGGVYFWKKNLIVDLMVYFYVLNMFLFYLLVLLKSLMKKKVRKFCICIDVYV